MMHKVKDATCHTLPLYIQRRYGVGMVTYWREAFPAVIESVLLMSGGDLLSRMLTGIVDRCYLTICVCIAFLTCLI